MLKISSVQLTHYFALHLNGDSVFFLKQLQSAFKNVIRIPKQEYVEAFALFFAANQFCVAVINNEPQLLICVFQGKGVGIGEWASHGTDKNTKNEIRLTFRVCEILCSIGC